MEEPLLDKLSKRRVILASASPRRQFILDGIGLNFEAIPSNYEEDLNPDDFPSPAAFAIATAVNKVIDVENDLKSKGETYDVLIGADTVVYMNGRVYGKPRSEEEAFIFLKQWSGTCHTVISGVCIKTPKKMVKFSECTNVHFRHLTDEAIIAYIKTGEPMDKAGGYGIQAVESTFVRRFDGDYFNVLGLPLSSFLKHLEQVCSP